MDYKNLSVCFTPAFFHIFSMKYDKAQNAKRRKRTFNSQKSEKDLEDTTVRMQYFEHDSKFSELCLIICICAIHISAFQDYCLQICCRVLSAVETELFTFS